VPGLGRPFPPGNRANPAGRPSGPGKLTATLRRLVGKEAKAVIEKIIEGAKNGNYQSQQLFMRLLPSSRIAEAMSFPMPRLDTAADLPDAVKAVAAGLADGSLTPSEASAVTGVIEAFGRACVSASYEERLAEIEQRLNIVVDHDDSSASQTAH
jgi:hypothetical protein